MVANNFDSLVTPKDAGKLLGGLRQEDVRRLIRDGKIIARKQIVRGENKKPRLFIALSEISRYIDSLEVTRATVPATHGERRRSVSRKFGKYV